jgi:hypothetical protein
VAEGPAGRAAGTIAERLRQARRRRFVGREGELERFRAALEAGEPPFTVLFVHGPGGVGKTALLDAFADAAAEAGAEPVRVDLRAVGASPPAFLAALPPHEGRRRRVLLLDTFEAAAGIEDWLRETFLPSLSAGTLVVLAGRNPPASPWREDPGWQELVRVIALRNLAAADARAYLRAAGVEDELAEPAAALTYGHPLALSLLVDVLAQRDGGAPSPVHDLAAAPDVVRRLQEVFLSEVPSDAHRRALHACAHARYTTEPLLRAALGTGDAGELFAWLCGLSFVEQAPAGVFPHDLVRDVLVADLRWRDPEAFAELRRRVRGHVIARVRETSGIEQQHAAADLVFLHRSNPFAQAQWDWASFGSAYGDVLRPADREPILAMTERWEGPEAAAIVAHWLERGPEGFTVVRDAGEQPVGFLLRVALHEATADDLAADPGARAMWEYAQSHAPPRPGETVMAARTLVDRDAHQGVSPTLNVVTIVSTQAWLTNPAIGWELIGAWTDPEAAEPLMSYIDFHRAPEADYEVGGRRYGVFARDWRHGGAERWLDLLGERETAAGFDPAASAPAAPVLALSQKEFADAVRRALRDLHRDDALAANPLLRSRVVRDRAGDGPELEALRDLLEEAAASLRVDPRDQKLERALARTYLRPAQTQELAAEALGLPFSTYRRHLTGAVARVADWLWQREIYGPDG